MIGSTLDDLKKASSKRGLVKKKVQVTREGRTFTQTKWVRPWGKKTPEEEPKAKPKSVLFDDEVQTIREMLEKEFNPELIAGKIERERDAMGEKPIPRKSIMHAINKVEQDIKKDAPWHGTGRRWSSILAEKMLGRVKEVPKAEPKKEVTRAPIEDPTKRESLEQATEKVENIQIKVSGLFARVHQLQTMLAMLQQRAESAKRVPKVAPKDKPVESKPRGEGAPRSSVRKARTLVSDIKAQLNTIETELKTLGIQDLGKTFPELSKKITATTTAIEAIKINLNRAEDSIKGLEKPTAAETVKDVIAPEKPAAKVVDEAKEEKPMSLRELAAEHKARAAERAKTLEAWRAKKEVPKREAPTAAQLKQEAADRAFAREQEASKRKEYEARVAQAARRQAEQAAVPSRAEAMRPLTMAEMKARQRAGMEELRQRIKEADEIKAAREKAEAAKKEAPKVEPTKEVAKPKAEELKKEVYTSKNVEVKLPNETKNVKAIVRGNWAIHQGVYDPERWTITHVPTGTTLLGSVKSEQHAKRLLQNVIKNNPEFENAKTGREALPGWQRFIKDEGTKKYTAKPSMHPNVINAAMRDRDMTKRPGTGWMYNSMKSNIGDLKEAAEKGGVSKKTPLVAKAIFRAYQDKDLKGLITKNIDKNLTTKDFANLISELATAKNPYESAKKLLSERYGKLTISKDREANINRIAAEHVEKYKETIEPLTKEEIADDKEWMKRFVEEVKSGKPVSDMDLAMYKNLSKVHGGENLTVVDDVPKTKAAKEVAKPKAETPKKPLEQVAERRKELAKKIAEKMAEKKTGLTLEGKSKIGTKKATNVKDGDTVIGKVSEGVVAHKESKTSGFIYERHDGTKSDRAYPDQTAALKAMKQEVADSKDLLKDLLDKKQAGEKLAPHELLMYKTLTRAEPGKKSTLDLLEAEGYKPKGKPKKGA